MPESVNSQGMRYVAQRLGLLAIFASMLFGSAGRLDRQRGTFQPGVKAFDRAFALTWLVLTLCTPVVMLGSAWTFVPALLVALLFVVRSHLEDQTLRREREGYEESTRRARFRLVPWVW